jgi:hypothetical protein
MIMSMIEILQCMFETWFLSWYQEFSELQCWQWCLGQPNQNMQARPQLGLGYGEPKYPAMSEQSPIYKRYQAVQFMQ